MGLIPCEFQQYFVEKRRRITEGARGTRQRRISSLCNMNHLEGKGFLPGALLESDWILIGFGGLRLRGSWGRLRMQRSKMKANFDSTGALCMIENLPEQVS
jgi:hypothetical protein